MTRSTPPKVQAPHEHEIPAAVKTMTVHKVDDGTSDAFEELTQWLTQEGVVNDARIVWLGYPNLRATIEVLLHWVGMSWPDSVDCDKSALGCAVVKALACIRKGLANDEQDQRLVVANFHAGLASLAHSVASYTAFGSQNERMVSQWRPFDKPFKEWANGEEFDQVDFVRKGSFSDLDETGTLWKMRTVAAPLRDIGVIARYSGR